TGADPPARRAHYPNRLLPRRSRADRGGDAARGGRFGLLRPQAWARLGREPADGGRDPAARARHRPRPPVQSVLLRGAGEGTRPPSPEADPDRARPALPRSCLSGPTGGQPAGARPAPRRRGGALAVSRARAETGRRDAPTAGA